MSSNGCFLKLAPDGVCLFLLVLLIIKVYEGRDYVPFVPAGPGLVPGTGLTFVHLPGHAGIPFLRRHGPSSEVPHHSLDENVGKALGFFPLIDADAKKITINQFIWC